MKPKVYLAGPITGLSYNGAVEWREVAKAKLADVGISAMSSMRSKDYLKSETDLKALNYKQPLSTDKGILCRDFRDCTTSDVVIMNLLGAHRVSIGSVMEIAWAHCARVPLVLVMESTGNLHEHGLMTAACNFRVDNLDEAINLAMAIILP